MRAPGTGCCVDYAIWAGARVRRFFRILDAVPGSAWVDGSLVVVDDEFPPVHGDWVVTSDNRLIPYDHAATALGVVGVAHAIKQNHDNG
jgi:hypothetical protein